MAPWGRSFLRSGRNCLRGCTALQLGLLTVPIETMTTSSSSSSSSGGPLSLVVNMYSSQLVVVSGCRVWWWYAKRFLGVTSVTRIDSWSQILFRRLSYDRILSLAYIRSFYYYLCVYYSSWRDVEPTGTRIAIFATYYLLSRTTGQSQRTCSVLSPSEAACPSDSIKFFKAIKSVQCFATNR